MPMTEIAVKITIASNLFGFDFNLNDSDVLADFGAAEGNFTLAVIDRIKKAYLFEYDPEWIEALRLTFKPWQDKVEIVPKFVSDKNDNKHCSGDVFFKDKSISFLLFSLL